VRSPVLLAYDRALGRSENLGVPLLVQRALSAHLVDIGLIDMPKTGIAMAP